MSFLTHLECPQCGRIFNSDQVQTYCHACQSPLLARYDLVSASKVITREEIWNRQPGMWRWNEVLPIKDPYSISTLGEGDTPLLSMKNLKSKYAHIHLFAKDESQNPTASFKARGLSAAVSKAKELGLLQLVIPTAGNAGSALAAYASRIGLNSAVVMPADAPPAIISECQNYGAQVTLIDGLISDCAKVVNEMISTGDWFSVSTFREPFRLEGKKIMGYELAETFGWQLPDAIIYPTGGGTGLVGMWKAFEEMRSLEWLDVQKMPGMYAVQSTGCAPVVEAFHAGHETCKFWKNADTIASGLRVPLSLADKLILQILRESEGSAVSVTDSEIMKSQKILAEKEGIFTSPEGAATLAALDKLISAELIEAGDQVILFMTASGVKYI